MRFSVSQELCQPIGKEVSIEFQAHTLFLDDANLSNLEGEARVLRIDRGLLVSVTARAEIQVACSRCLVPMKSPIDIDFQEEFVPVVDPVSGQRAWPDVEDAFLIDADMMLDLGEPLRQYALMSEPSKPLCIPDCAGLCSACGTRLNEGACSCPTLADERWKALSALRSK